MYYIALRHFVSPYKHWLCLEIRKGYQFNDARNDLNMNSGRYQFVMIIPDQIFLSFIISFSSTSRDEQKQRLNLFHRFVGGRKSSSMKSVHTNFRVEFSPRWNLLQRKTWPYIQWLNKYFCWIGNPTSKRMT